MLPALQSILTLVKMELCLGLLLSLDLFVYNVNLLASIQLQVVFILEFSLDFSWSIQSAVTTKQVSSAYNLGVKSTLFERSLI